MVVVAGAVAVYYFTNSMASKANERSNTPATVLVESVQPPSKYTVIVSGGQSTPQLLEPLKITVRNIGRMDVKADIVYIKKPGGNLVLSYKLSKPVVIKPGCVETISIPISYEDYQRLQKTLGSSPYMIISLGSSTGVSASSSVPSTWLEGGELKLENVQFNMTMVIINCTDAGGWWVDVNSIIQAALNAAQKVRGLRIVVVNSTEDLYYLFHDQTLKGYDLNGNRVEENLAGKTTIIINAHGEPLPIPPQYVRHIDADGKLEVCVKEYASDIRKALSSNPWTLVTVVGASLYYLSNNGFYNQSTTLYFKYTYSNGTTVSGEVNATYLGDYTDATKWNIETDAGILEFNIRKGEGYPRVIVVVRKLTNYILSGVWGDNGPSWDNVQCGWENRLAINGKSWHNFHKDWGGSVAPPATSAVSSINSFFEANLPPSISAARAVSSASTWYNEASQYLYGWSDAGTTGIGKVVLHYDDFTTNQLDAGLGRVMPYWAVLSGTMSVGGGTLSLSTNTSIVRLKIGWGDVLGIALSRILSRAELVTYNITIESLSGSGRFYALLGNRSSTEWLAVELSVQNGTVKNVSLVSMDPAYRSVATRVALMDNLDINPPLGLSISIATSGITVSLGGSSSTRSWSDIQGGLGFTQDNTRMWPGFATNDISATLSAPFEVYASNWNANTARASAVFSVGEGKLIIAGYSPPNGIVKEYGYSLSDVRTNITAEIAVYYPLYIILKNAGVPI